MALLPCLEGRETVLKVFKPLNQLRIAFRIEQDAREATAFGNVERLFALTKRIQLAAQFRAKIISSHYAGHFANLSANPTVNRRLNGSVQVG